jgi:hypothetical protein
VENKRKPKIKLELRRRESKHGKNRWALRYGRYRKDGTVGWSEKDWEVRPTSMLPKALFHPLQTSILHYVSKIPKDERSFPMMAEKILEALRQEARAWGCEYKDNSYNGLHWLLKHEKLIAFTVIDFEGHHSSSYLGKDGLSRLAQRLRELWSVFGKMERRSGAVFRIAVVVLKGGYWRIVPGKSRA